MRFLGTLFVIGGALGALTIVLILIAGALVDQFEGQLGEDIPLNFTGLLIGYTVFLVAFVVLYIWAGVVLWQAADGIRDAHRHGAVAELENGLGKLRVFFVVLGVVYVGLIVVGVVGAVVSFNVASSLTPSIGAAAAVLA